MSHGGGEGQNSAKKVSRIIWTAHATNLKNAIVGQNRRVAHYALKVVLLMHMLYSLVEQYLEL